MEQLSLQDAIQAKDEGIAQVAASNAGWVGLMQKELARLCRIHGSATADDLRPYCDIIGYPAHQNAWGAGPKSGAFTCIAFEPSKIKSNHGRLIRRWALASQHQ